MTGLVRSSHSVSQCVYHIEWCTKYRHPVFSSREYKTLCEAVLMSISEEHGITIIEMAVMPEHIHMLVQVPVCISLVQVLQFLKGESSYRLFRIIPKLREWYWAAGLWSPGKFVRTVGDVDIDKTREYVRNQPIHHHGRSLEALGFSPR